MHSHSGDNRHQQGPTQAAVLDWLTMAVLTTYPLATPPGTTNARTWRSGANNKVTR
jgi:hypothetical protein